MLWLRMAVVAIRLAWPDLLAPWRSPLLRWRIETFGLRGADGRMLHAPEITPGRFLAFVTHHRKPLARFLRWAASL